ncbi:MAG: Ty3/Gypsy family RNase HI domain-containing protein, partial [bacterium]
QASDKGPERPIAFASKGLNSAQRNYTATQKEGLAVVWAINHFKSYIHGIPTVVETDHNALTWILNLKEPNSRMARWVMAIMEYDLTFVHRKGAENRIADALSRLTREFREGQDKDLNNDGPSPIFVNLVTNIQNASDVASLKQAGSKEIPEPNDVEHLEKYSWELAQSEDATIGAMKRWLVEDIKPSEKALAKWVESKEDQFVMFDGLLNFVEIIP